MTGRVDCFPCSKPLLGCCRTVKMLPTCVSLVCLAFSTSAEAMQRRRALLWKLLERVMEPCPENISSYSCDTCSSRSPRCVSQRAAFQQGLLALSQRSHEFKSVFGKSLHKPRTPPCRFEFGPNLTVQVQKWGSQPLKRLSKRRG